MRGLEGGALGGADDEAWGGGCERGGHVCVCEGRFNVWWEGGAYVTWGCLVLCSALLAFLRLALPMLCLALPHCGCDCE